MNSDTWNTDHNENIITMNNSTYLLNSLYTFTIAFYCSHKWHHKTASMKFKKKLLLLPLTTISAWTTYTYNSYKSNKIQCTSTQTKDCFIHLFLLFSVRLLSVLCGHSVFSSPPQRPNDLRLRRIFCPRVYPLHLFSYLNSWERASSFPLECSVLNKGTTGTIFITSLVWRVPWLGIEPGTSRTRSHHYTTRLSRRPYET